MPGPELVPHLQFAPASASASIDAIVFLRTEPGMGFPFSHLGREMTPWEADFSNADIARRIRELPESCAMRDGRKWKRIPIIVLTSAGRYNRAFDGVDVDFVVDSTDSILYSGSSSTLTWRRVEEAVNRYQRKILGEYKRVGFLVTDDHGRYRIKRAYRKKNQQESEYYLSGKDKRRFRGFVTIGRESEGVEHEAALLEGDSEQPQNR